MIWLVIRWLFLHVLLGKSLIEELLPKLPFWPSVMVIIIASIYGFGHYNGHKACESDHKAAELKLEKKYDKNKTKTDNLNHDQLFRRLHKFQRD